MKRLYTPVAVTVQVTCNFIDELAGKVGIVKPVPCSAAIVRVAGQTAPPTKSPAAQVTAVQFKPVAAGSMTTVLLADDGPALLT